MTLWVVFLYCCRDPSALAYAIKRSCENKAEVVSLDEKESGVRATLNLGHTFGHVSSELRILLYYLLFLMDFLLVTYAYFCFFIYVINS